MSATTLDWSKGDGLLPCVVQHALDGRVLMLGYMNREAFEATTSSRTVTFWSRSRARLWTKGETSGNRLDLVSLHVDCDADSILALATPAGPTCHLGIESCFGDAAPVASIFGRLDATIASRERERPAGSYTTALFEAGLRRIAQKVGEEGVETSLAAVVESDEALLGEASDLVYHLLVLLRARGVGATELAAALGKRHR